MKAVVIGGGHNGLVAAAALSKAGHAVTLIERRPALGGAAAGEEFHPGYRHTGVLHDADRVSPEVVRALGLKLDWRDAPAITAVGDGRRVEGLRLSAPSDVRERHSAFSGFLHRLRPFVSDVATAPAPDIGDEASVWPLVQKAWGLRRLGAADMREVLQVGPMPIDDWLSEHVDDPVARAALAWDGLVGTWMGPRSPIGMATWFWAALTSGREPRGGPDGFVRALIDACGKVTMRTGTVSEIAVSGGRVRGVVVGGQAVPADVVVAAIGPRRALLELVPADALDPLIARDIADVRVRGILGKIHLALSGPLGAVAGEAGPERLRIGAHPNDLERAFDDAKMGRAPLNPPPLDVRVPTVADPALAPAGHHVASILVHGVAHSVPGGWTQPARDALLDKVLTSLEQVDGAVRSRVVAAEVLVPPDLEERFDAEGGHLFHGEHALDQLWVMRPTAPLARHAVPGIKGLFLGSSGVHPGGGVTGLPGLLAARAALTA